MDIEYDIEMAVTKVSDTKAWEIDVMNSEVPVFVDFWAEWCGPCRMVSPVVEELSNDYDGKIKFVKVNVDEANELASKYNIFSIPTLAIFNKGQLVTQQVGAASKESYFVDFWAEWCGPCRMVSPVVEELSNDYDGKIKFVKVNVDEANELASKYNVFSIPTLAIFNKGQLVTQQVGAASKESYKNMIEKALGN